MGLSTNCLGQPSRPDRAGEFLVLQLQQESRTQDRRSSEQTGTQEVRCADVKKMLRGQQRVAWDRMQVVMGVLDSAAWVWISLPPLKKSRDIILLTNVSLVKAMVFPVVMYGCESWTIKKTER